MEFLPGTGFTDRLLAPTEENQLLDLGYGITNLVARATAAAAELANEECMRGAKILERKVLSYRPEWIAFIGLGAYRVAFKRANAVIGLQREGLGSAKVWAPKGYIQMCSAELQLGRQAATGARDHAAPGAV